METKIRCFANRSSFRFNASQDKYPDSLGIFNWKPQISTRWYRMGIAKFFDEFGNQDFEVYGN